MSEPQLPREVRRRLAFIHKCRESHRRCGHEMLAPAGLLPAAITLAAKEPMPTHIVVMGKILDLRQNQHSGPGKIAR